MRCNKCVIVGDRICLHQTLAEKEYQREEAAAETMEDIVKRIQQHHLDAWLFREIAISLQNRKDK